MEKENIIGKYYKYRGTDSSWKVGDIYLVAEDGTISFDISKYKYRCDRDNTYMYIIDRKYFEPSTEENITDRKEDRLKRLFMKFIKFNIWRE